MPLSGFFIDTNLLVLLVVGSVGRDLISKHSRLQSFEVDDYDRLLRLIRNFKRVFVTPNTLTETSNLLAQHRDPERSYFFRRFRRIIESSKEVVVASDIAAANKKFTELGLSDAVLLEAVTEERPLITVDSDLHRAALSKGPRTAVNFLHLKRRRR